MWAVVVTVEVPEDLDVQSARRGIEEELVPHAPSMPGFVRASWLSHEHGRTGMGIHEVETEEDARQIAAQLEVGGDAGVGATVRSVELFEVLAQA